MDWDATSVLKLLPSGGRMWKSRAPSTGFASQPQTPRAKVHRSTWYCKRLARLLGVARIRFGALCLAQHGFSIAREGGAKHFVCVWRETDVGSIWPWHDFCFQFNFVGKLLGPKGNSLKRLQEETMTKMAVLGRGSMKDRTKVSDWLSSLFFMSLQPEKTLYFTDQCSVCASGALPILGSRFFSLHRKKKCFLFGITGLSRKHSNFIRLTYLLPWFIGIRIWVGRDENVFLLLLL